MNGLTWHDGIGGERFAFGVNARGRLFKVTEITLLGMTIVFSVNNRGDVVAMEGTYDTADAAVAAFALTPEVEK